MPNLADLLKYGNIIFPCAIAIFIVLMVISIIISNKKLYLKSLILSFINVFIFIIFAVIYDKYILINDIFQIIYVILVGINFIAFLFTGYLTFRNSLLKSNEYQLIIDGVQNTKFNAYYVIDNHDRILDIADSLVDELGAVKEEVIGKKLFDVFDRTIRIKKFNNLEINNKGLREFYLDYKSSSKPNQKDIREIQFQNYNGVTIILNVIEQPIFLLGKYRGRLVFGEKRAASTMMSMERELLEVKQELNSLTAKFMTTLDVTEEGLFFMDLNEEYIWGTDHFKKILGLPSNTIGITDLKGLMFESDYEAYKITISNLSPEKPKYSVTYRSFVNGNYVWIKEHGKRIFDEDCPNMILGFVKSIETGNNYEKSNTDLDSIKTDFDLYKDLDSILLSNKPFEIVIVNVSNIPDINDKYGRNIGNIMLNRYISLLKQSLGCDQIYRISGLEFVVLMSDVRKMDMLKTILKSDANAMDLQMNYGSIDEKIKVQIGIAEGYTDGDTPEKIVTNCKKALNVAKNPNFNKTYCYYKEIR